jgi:hypothetical protein
MIGYLRDFNVFSDSRRQAESDEEHWQSQWHPGRV